MTASTAKPKPASIANNTLPVTTDWPTTPTIIAAALIDDAIEAAREVSIGVLASTLSAIVQIILADHPAIRTNSAVGLSGR